jgi:hypothetical protein
MSGDNEHGWGRAHAAAFDFDSEADARMVAERYRVAPLWEGYDIDVLPVGQGKWFIAARKRPEK